MNGELKFLGPWGPWPVVLAGLAAGIIAWLLYRRDPRVARNRVSWMLPLFRSMVVMLALLILSEPMVNYRTVVGERGRVLVFVDGSESMRLTDEIMEPARKFLFLRHMGWIPPDAFDPQLGEAAFALARARTAARETRPDAPKSFAREIEEAQARIPAARRELFREKLLAPAQSGHKPLPELLQEAARWEKELWDEIMRDPRLQAALQKFDGLTRWNRVEALLTQGLLKELSKNHDVELLVLDGAKARILWSSREQGSDSCAWPSDPSSHATNLSDGILDRIGEKDEERVAVVLFSDGQHNDGRSPVGLSKLLGERQTPAHTVCVGAVGEPEDLAVLRVRGPESVFCKDRVKGEIVLRDDMAAGKSFTLRIECGERVVWEKPLTTDGTHLRTVPFDFSIESLSEKILANRDRNVQVHSLPLFMKVTASPVAGEKEKGNNTGELNVRSILSRRKILILEGRPRWEFRYLRNLFERDAQWEVNALLADSAGGWPKGFPADREALLAYDLIVFGEVPRALLKPGELQWFRDFVEKRGGGLVAIDGRRGHLAEYARTQEFGPLLPVDWETATSERPSRLRLTERGAQIGHLDLVTGSEKNGDVWDSLPPPHWAASVHALPGSETLVEAMIGERKVPALVFHRFGAGSVLYASFDESWRWRYEVGEPYHQRYWNQVARWIMEPDFSASDARVSLDAGKIANISGEQVQIRARVRDAQGRAIEKADVEAILFRDGRRVESVKLSPDENAGGLYRGRASPVECGLYEVRLQVSGLSDTESRVRAEFAVRPRESGELDSLAANDGLLRQMAANSGGEFFWEEASEGLISRLEPLRREKVVESSTILWQSYAWFISIVALLAAEWILRKFCGMP